MAVFMLTAKNNVKSPLRTYGLDAKAKDLEKGFMFRATNSVAGAEYHPERSGVENKYLVGALIVAGFSKEEAEMYANSSWSVNFDISLISKDTDFKFQDKLFQAQLHREDYSALKDLKSNKASETVSSDEETSNSKSGAGARSGGGLAMLAGLFVGAAAMSQSSSSSSSSSGSIVKKILPKPKSSISRASTTPTSSTSGVGKKSLVSMSRLSGISNKRPLATGLLSNVKGSSSSGGLLGGIKKSGGGLLGGVKKSSSGLATKKTGSLLGGTKTKSTGKTSLLGGTSKSTGGGLLGGAKKSTTSSTRISYKYLLYTRRSL